MTVETESNVKMIVDKALASIGDIATLIGPDHPSIHPNAVATATGRSVYDVLMHLNPELPKVIV